jgi:hypothetical protein
LGHPVPDNYSDLNVKTLVVPPQDAINELYDTLSLLPPQRQASFCIAAAIAVPRVFPRILRTGQFQMNILDKLGATGKLAHHLTKESLRNGPVTHEEAFLIKRTDISYFIGPELLTLRFSIKNRKRFPSLSETYWRYHGQHSIRFTNTFWNHSRGRQHCCY